MTPWRLTDSHPPARSVGAQRAYPTARTGRRGTVFGQYGDVDVLGPAVFYLVEPLLVPFARVGHRRRVARAARRGLVYSGVRRGTTWTTGPTEVGPSRLRIANQDLRVRSVEGPGRSLPPWPGQREGEDYFFSAPATRVFTLRTDRGTVAWAVPEDQADSALQRLGVPRTTRRKDGRDWTIGTDTDVAWINGSTEVDLTITAAIPPIYADYATIVVPDGDARAAVVGLVLRLLAEQSGEQPWWLGYLDTGADDVVFPDAPRVTLYAGWSYVLVQAGPHQATTWRTDPDSWRAPGPDLAFPADRSWLMSWLWDDDWLCLGGPVTLVDALLEQPSLDVRRVGPDEDPTPPGHVAC